MEYLYSISLILIFIGCILSCIFLKSKKFVSIIIFFISLILLIWKTVEFSYYAYIQNGIYPIEISHVSYFLVGVVFVFGIKKLYYTAGFFAFISGLGYFFAGIISPLSIINSLTQYLFIMGYISHTLLLFIGMLILFNFKKFSYKDIYIPYFSFGILLIFAYLVSIKVLYPLASGIDSMFVIKLIKGDILSYFNIFSNYEINIIISCLVVLIILILIFLLYYINQKIFRKRSENDYDFNLISFIKTKNKN